jgi:hypothetical protein
MSGSGTTPAPITAAELQAQIQSLENARMTGIRSVKDQNGEEIEYRSDQEMAAAIADAKTRLQALLNATPSQPKAIHFHTSKGLYGPKRYY